MSIYRVLDNPAVYKLSQLLFAPGQHLLMKRKLDQLAKTLSHSDRILDIGCGPDSWLSRVGLSPVGLDISPEYVREFCGSGARGVVSSAAFLPFQSQAFDSVWTVGLLHHLDDVSVMRTVMEMLRVCRPGGAVIIVDAVMPRSAVVRPAAYAIRKMDRGRFIRSEEQFSSLLAKAVSVLPKPERFTFSLNGLEAVAFLIFKDSLG